MYVISLRACVRACEQNTTEVRLPRDTMALLEYPECYIELGCAYAVRIESNHPADERALAYTVPGRHTHTPNTRQTCRRSFVAKQIPRIRHLISIRFSTPNACSL